MTNKNFKSLSLRRTLAEEVKKFIEENPDFVAKNPEFNTVSGFIDKATREKLEELKAQEATA